MSFLLHNCRQLSFPCAPYLLTKATCPPSKIPLARPSRESAATLPLRLSRPTANRLLSRTMVPLQTFTHLSRGKTFGRQPTAYATNLSPSPRRPCRFGRHPSAPNRHRPGFRKQKLPGRRRHCLRFLSSSNSTTSSHLSSLSSRLR